MAANSIYVRNFRTEIPGALSADKLSWEFPCVYSVNSHSKTIEWRIYVRLQSAQQFIIIDDEYFNNRPMNSDITGWIKVDSNVVGGKIKKSEPTIVLCGKNLGKASATNVFCQSLRDAFSLYNKQNKKAIPAQTTQIQSTQISTTTERYPPMLAQVLKDQKTMLNFADDIFIQRKYNGVRTITTLDTDRVIMYSRRKLLYPGFDYIKSELATVVKDYWNAGRQLYLDGEIYKHGAALQDISGQARRETRPDDIQYDYMIYDCFVANQPQLKFSERNQILRDIFDEYKLTFSKYVDTYTVTSHEEVQKYYNQFIGEKFEGAMVRIDETYRYSYNEYHCKYLLKMKETYDEEFTVVDWKTGDKGKASRALMIICETTTGIKFPCTPALELDERIRFAEKMSTIEANGKTYFENNWLGKMIIVYFDEYSKDKVPQRARTKMVVRTWQ